MKRKLRKSKLCLHERLNLDERVPSREHARFGRASEHELTISACPRHSSHMLDDFDRMPVVRSQAVCRPQGGFQQKGLDEVGIEPTTFTMFLMQR
jgi:hypothetical protein